MRLILRRLVVPNDVVDDAASDSLVVGSVV